MAVFCALGQVPHKGKTRIITKTLQKGELPFSWTRRFRSIRFIHIVRKFSALAVVAASAFFVAYHNVQSQKGSEGMFPFYNDEEKKENAFRAVSDSSTNVALLPYVRPSAIDPESAEDADTTEEEIDMLVAEQESVSNQPSAALSSQSLIATANAMEEPKDGDGVTIYEVKKGDTISSIAADHDVTVNTILWANTLEDEDSIQPGDEIFILPVSGLKHIVKDGESIDDIAKEYDVDAKQIIVFNTLPATGAVKTGTEIIIPGGTKEIPQEVKEPAISTRSYAQLSGGTKTVENRHGKPNLFPYGWCTWYVAQKVYVPWRGNAGAWLYNAKAMGYKTSTKPQAGAIVVTTDNSRYGHVALVEKVSGDSIVVSEMNYEAWGKVNKRTISISDRRIRGYILASRK